MKTTNMKKGITLIEIVLAIVLIAIIAGITIPKLMSNSAKAEMKTVITSDLKSIIEAANTWKKSASTSGGNFQNISATEIFSRLPSNMAVQRTQGIIFSSGLRTGTTDSLTSVANATGVIYTIAWQFDSTTFNDTGRFSIGMSVKNGVDDLSWDPQLTQYARDVFQDVIFEVTDNESDPHNAAFATVGTASVSMPCDTDAICLGNMRVN